MNILLINDVILILYFAFPYTITVNIRSLRITKDEMALETAHEKNIQEQKNSEEAEVEIFGSGSNCQILPGLQKLRGICNIASVFQKEEVREDAKIASGEVEEINMKDEEITEAEKISMELKQRKNEDERLDHDVIADDNCDNDPDNNDANEEKEVEEGKAEEGEKEVGEEDENNMEEEKEEEINFGCDKIEKQQNIDEV